MVWQKKLMEKKEKTWAFIIDWVINPPKDHSLAQVVSVEEASQTIDHCKETLEVNSGELWK